GSRAFYVRAHRALLPPHAPDMLTARTQAIGGAGTLTLLDFGLVGCSFPYSPRVIPDGRISRVRLATMTVPAQSSLPPRGLSAHSHTPRARRVYRAAR